MGDLELYDHDAKSDVVIVMNASPFSINKLLNGFQIIQNLSRKYFNQYIIYSNCVCAQDSLVFDGGSFVMKNAQMIVAPVQWKEKSDNSELINNITLYIMSIRNVAYLI